MPHDALNPEIPQPAVTRRKGVRQPLVAPASLRSKRWVASREEILQAAAQVFIEKGFGSTSIDEIADRLNATKGRIYHYYRSKVDLFLDLQIWALEHLLAKLLPITNDPLLAPPARLYQMAYHHTIMIGTGYGFEGAALLGRESSLLDIRTTDQHRARRRVIDLRDQYEDLFALVLEDGIQLKLFAGARPRLMTKPLLSALNGLLEWYSPAKGSQAMSIEQIADYHATFVTNAVLARPGNGQLPPEP